MSASSFESYRSGTVSSQLETVFGLPSYGGSNPSLGAPEEDMTLAHLESFMHLQSYMMDRIASYAKFPAPLRARSLTEIMRHSRYMFGNTVEHFLCLDDMAEEDRALHVVGLIRYADAFQRQRIKEIEPRTEIPENRLDVEHYQEQIVENMAPYAPSKYSAPRAVATYSKFLANNMNNLAEALDDTRRGKAAVMLENSVRGLKSKRGLAAVGAAAVYGGLFYAAGKGPVPPTAT